MKLNIKQLIISSAIISIAVGVSSCNKFLDREPITDVTIQAYFTSPEQLSSYTIKGYNSLSNSRGQTLYHQANWSAGVTTNDNNTDNYQRYEADLNYFAGNKQVPTGQKMGDYAESIRYWNFFLENALDRKAKGQISGSSDEINQQIGEGYFFRAFTYYKALVAYGDYPIVTEVLKNKKEQLIGFSKRKPRNEVARFILKDLDNAISMLHDKGYKNNLRINKQAAELFKSRVALFEGIFEKYHRGTGRVPGDATWPGKDMPYNKGKNFDIDAEINFFLEQAMDAAKSSTQGSTLVNNSHQINPQYKQISGWNPYFDMFNSVDLSANSEVLLWKQYNSGLGVTHDASYILTPGGDNSGLTLSYVNSFLMKNGLPIYATSSGYKGDVSLENQESDRDERLQLFVFKQSDASRVDPEDPSVKSVGHELTLDSLQINTSTTELKDLTGFRPRKYVSYNYQQLTSNHNPCFTACPIFRIAESYLNYIEASYEKNGTIDATAEMYWKSLRRRAGVDEDYNKTISNTNLDKEVNIGTIDGISTVMGDLAVYSGDKKVDPTLYNIRRERRDEFISEGMRWDDLKRWRSWDLLLTHKYQIMGINLWDEAYKKYSDLVDSGDNKNISSKALSKYILPLTMKEKNNPLKNGYSWMKAYYLEPLGVQDFTITETVDGEINSTVSYQNPYWPMTPGKALE